MRAELLEFLRETPLLDYSAKPIEKLIENRGWKMLDEFHRIQKIYDFVRNEILFGYNVRDDLPASRVLSDGYGQCNTKGTLFMALLRADGIPCRLHGFTIDKKLQKGAMTGIVYEKAPREILHSWVEVCSAANGRSWKHSFSMKNTSVACKRNSPTRERSAATARR